MGVNTEDVRQLGLKVDSMQQNIHQTIYEIVKKSHNQIVKAQEKL